MSIIAIILIWLTCADNWCQVQSIDEHIQGLGNQSYSGGLIEEKGSATALLQSLVALHPAAAWHALQQPTFRSRYHSTRPDVGQVHQLHSLVHGRAARAPVASRCQHLLALDSAAEGEHVSALQRCLRWFRLHRTQPRQPQFDKGGGIGRAHRFLRWFRLERAQSQLLQLRQPGQIRWRKHFFTLAVALLFTLPSGPASASELGGRLALAFLTSQGKPRMWQIDNNIDIVQSDKRYVVEVDNAVKDWLNRHFTNPNDLFEKVGGDKLSSILEEEMKEFAVSTAAAKTFSLKKLAGALALPACVYLGAKVMTNLDGVLGKMRTEGMMEEEMRLTGRYVSSKVQEADLEVVFDPQTGKNITMKASKTESNQDSIFADKGSIKKANVADKGKALKFTVDLDDIGARFDKDNMTSVEALADLLA